jgi:formylglycine-generating enzyme required for sulfatase activity
MNILIDIVLGKSGSSISLSSSNEIITVKGIYINEMMAVEDGAFTIGVANERGFEGFSSNEVTLSSLKIGDYEVTQELWLAVMGTIQASFTGNLKHPVKNVSWDDCQQFITRLNTISGKTFQLSLVTE